MGDEILKIESIIKQQKSIQDAKIIVNHDKKGNKEYFAYLVAKPNQLRSNNLIKTFAEENLPKNLVPSQFTSVEDLNALNNISSDNEANEPEYFKDHKKPRTETEQNILEIWTEVLNKEKISIDEVFFDIGGDSLKCTQVFFLINEKYPNTISLVDLFKFITIESISNYTDQNEQKEDLEGITL